ncbi:hypothetical protein L9F63_011360, partial [Diploptera punctata]
MFRIVNSIRIAANSQHIKEKVKKLPNINKWRLNSTSLLVNEVKKQEICFGQKCYVSNKQETCFTRISIQQLWCSLEKKKFHTSPVRNVPPVFLLLIKPLGKIAAIVFGKTIKVWWLKLPPERRETIRLGVRKNRWKFYTIFGLIPSGFLLYYVAHLEENPITGRRRFIIVSEEQMMNFAQLELEAQIEAHQGNFLPPSHPAFKRVTNVCNRLLKSNRDMKQIQSRKWLVTVVDEPSVKNAFVLPTGHIFMFTGLLSECMNDDQLSIILAHEMSHVILNHSAEQISNLGFLDMILVIPFLLIWVVLPDAAAAITHWVSDYLSRLMFHLPFSRALETEADTFGLQLAAR